MSDEFDEGEELLFEGAQCCRCDLDLDSCTGLCTNDRCPFHDRCQDEIVSWSPPDEDEDRRIDQIRAELPGEGKC